MLWDLRLRSYPFSAEVSEFIDSCDRVYVVEQNRDGQMLSLLKISARGTFVKLRSIRHYVGLPIDGRSVTPMCCGRKSHRAHRQGTPGNMATPEQPAAPAKKVNRMASSRSRTVARRRRLRGVRADAIPSASSTRSTTRRRSVAGRQAVRHRLSSKSPRIPGQRSRLQLRARLHAVGWHRRGAREPKMIAIGISGDGDTGAIGIGQFVHRCGGTCRSSTSSRTTAATA